MPAIAIMKTFGAIFLDLFSGIARGAAANTLAIWQAMLARMVNLCHIASSRKVARDWAQVVDHLRMGVPRKFKRGLMPPCSFFYMSI
jgi:hypothetical protein